MKKLIYKISSSVTNMGINVALATNNQVTIWVNHQPKKPENIDFIKQRVKNKKISRSDSSSSYY